MSLKQCFALLPMGGQRNNSLCQMIYIGGEQELHFAHFKFVFGGSRCIVIPGADKVGSCSDIQSHVVAALLIGDGVALPDAQTFGRLLGFRLWFVPFELLIEKLLQAGSSIGRLLVGRKWLLRRRRPGSVSARARPTNVKTKNSMQKSARPGRASLRLFREESACISRYPGDLRVR